MTNTVWFQGIEQMNTLERQLARNTTATLVAADRLVRSSGFAIQQWGQAFAPVDTGFLRGSITTEFTGGVMAGFFATEVGPEAEYAPFVEYGTERMAPFAFMGPALDRVSPSFVLALEAMADPLAGPGVMAGGGIR